MKTTVDGVEITLTSKQIAIIAKETKKIKTITNFRDIKTFEDACKVLPEDYKVFKKCYKLLSKDTLNYERLRIIIKAINPKGYIPDFNNSDERKWYNWFEYVNGGFSCYSTYCSSTGTGVPSALYFSDDERAKHASKVFLEDYKKIYINNK